MTSGVPVLAAAFGVLLEVITDLYRLLVNQYGEQRQDPQLFK